MKFRANIILQYSLATVGIVLGITAALGVTLTRRITDFQLRSHVHLFQEVARITVRDDDSVYALFASNDPRSISPGVEAKFSEFLSLGNIFRVKVWGKGAQILWSDQKELIGESFPDNDGFQNAMAGEVSYEIAEPEKRENVNEKDHGVALEIYIPVFRGGVVAGVIELYEASRDLFAQIARNTFFTWALVVLAGVVLWLLLFIIFLGAYRRQKRITAELVETQDVTIFALAYQAELRDRQTGKHLERTATYVRLLAEGLARLPLYRAYLTPSYIEDLVKSAPLHDIGKVGIPDAILLKPEKLTPVEMEEMKKHCTYGSRVLLIAEKKLKFQSFLTIAIQLALYHHERWDGSGYPHGLAGEAIPLSGRIMALADNYDALRTPRAYKEPFPHEQSCAIIREQSGTHFDPRLVDAFLGRHLEFERISRELAD
jgi:HD-GYP domain-containing protein (c-di-GMP phosphodiesterase class II)